MKTAISIPDAEFERFERVAARHGLNRSEFYRRAADRLAQELEGSSDLTRIANAVIERAGQPSADDVFVRESERQMIERTEW
ncbi:metal-responsive CopG/Arc/MetJ family transcriptional regulator [Curtobacterium flaccumfaciens]|jgi:metal-responsive CopG/Arc/MetJ family transcriptional regulator|uniref:Metal-responsive CopG/Arc/MetJ family transcriptional regulator n=1 Tax=Curtobacterium salicis TaxID=1779862 RepID=A0ABX0T346_9MICO|nr:CopG family transcriptional regulator [Curtobacterium sp. WW7]NII39900.1 metal-responsive CopG/Arc/MetJ family transcriptional regulator [Curtobacterium sp. WW7]